MARLWVIPSVLGLVLLAEGIAEVAGRSSPPCHDTAQCMAPGLPAAIWAGSLFCILGLIMLGSAMGSSERARAVLAEGKE